MATRLITVVPCGNRDHGQFTVEDRHALKRLQCPRLEAASLFKCSHCGSLRLEKFEASWFLYQNPVIKYSINKSNTWQLESAVEGLNGTGRRRLKPKVGWDATINVQILRKRLQVSPHTGS